MLNMTATTWFRPGLVTGITLLAAGTMLLPQSAQGKYELPEVSFSEEMQADSPVTLRAAEPAPAETVPASEREYTVKLEKGALYVYEAGRREPVCAYAVQEAGMPDYDRILLEYGIRVTGEAALREVLEDYAS